MHRPSLFVSLFRFSSGPCRLTGLVALAALALLGLLPSPAIAATNDGLSLYAEDDAVVVRGVAAGERILLVGHSRFFNGSLWQTATTEELLDDSDGDGVVRFVPENGDIVAPESVWMAVDLSTGAAIGSGLGGAKPRAIPSPRELVRSSGFTSDGLADVLHARSGRMQFWVVRPENSTSSGGGVWAHEAVDGQETDRDEEENGEALVELADFVGRGSSTAPPEALEEGDVVVGLAPRALDFFVVRLNAVLLAGGGALDSTETAEAFERSVHLTTEAASRARAQGRNTETGGKLPNFERGFDADQLYEWNDLDQVNLFNGNLSLTIPIGITYPVGDGFSYGFSLVYNSRLWDWESNSAGAEASASTRFNAGIGWRFSLGELFAPNEGGHWNPGPLWVYSGPDGADHSFYGIGGDWYETRDGSYLRLELIGDNTRRIHFGSGELHTFTAFSVAGSTRPLYRLTRIEDRFGNALTVHYNGSGRQWSKITDTVGREHTATWAPRTWDGVTRHLPQTVDLAAFGGERATWVFGYEPGAASIPRPINDYRGGHVAVPLLRSLTSPEAGTTRPYTLRYWGGPGGPAGNATTGGMLSSLTLPTLGKLVYTWREWKIPVIVSCEDTPPGTPNVTPPTTPGVATRERRAHSGADLGRWRYENATHSSVESVCSPSNPSDQTKEQYTTTTVTTPLGDKERHYFSGWMAGSRGIQSRDGYRSEEQGLPFSRHVSDTLPNSTEKRYLSREILDCDGKGNCPVVRQVFSRWEWNKESCEPLSSCGNRRERSSHTRYLDDGNRFTYEEKTCFDGYGNYRRQVTGGNLPGSLFKIARTEHHPSRGVLRVDNDGVALPGGACGLSPWSPWPKGDPGQPFLLGTYTYKTIEEGGVKARTDYGFDPRTGFLSHKRVREQASGTSPGDVRTRWSRQAFGAAERRITERIYGGDLHSADAAAPAYVREARYRYGTLSRAGFVGYPVELSGTVDPSTGYLSRSTDGSGLGIDYSFDRLGRIRRLEPDQTTWLEYRYTRPEGNDGGWVYTHYRPNGKRTGGDLARERVRFDNLGRLNLESRLLPGGIWSNRIIGYDPSGNRRFVSEWGDTSKRTQFLSYDPFGRARVIRPPEGKVHQKRFVYRGIRLTTEWSEVGAGGSGSDVTLESIPKRLHYDAFGRLSKVEEHSAGAAKSRVQTAYTYDHADRLRTVRTSHGGVTQKRTFSYDLRGFLVSEDRPERTAGHAPKETRYADYDALGNVGFVRNAWRQLCHRYDGAGRPVRIDFSFAGDCQNEEGGFLPLKEWQWSNASSGSNRSGGKVTRLVRHNHLTLYRPDREDHVVRVEQELEYWGRGGLASSRRTGIYVNDNLSNAFSQGFEYDDLGATIRIHYPRCEGGGYATPCTNDPAPSRSVSFEYGRGFLRKVPGYINSVGYHRNQALASIVFRNGVTETHTLDPYSKRRPRRISTSGVGSNRNWSTGTYTYDGSGNVLSIGGSWYRYDAVHRLAEAGVHLARGGAGSERRQVFTYDVFGNLQRTAGGGGRATPTSQHTNRLTVAGTRYQQDGSLIEADGRIFRYGAFGEVLCASSVFPDNPCVQDDGSTSPPSQQSSAVYIYDASDERIWEYDLAARSQWAIRDLGGQVLREYTTDNGVFTYEDTIRGLGRVLAAETSEGRRYLHTDHLGTVRQTTDREGNEVAYDVYYPYGREATTSEQDGLQWKFTGHERDFNHTGSAEDDLDYMHARYYSPGLGRFTTTDPINSGKPGFPQTWNKYTYATASPLTKVDPDGREPVSSTVVVVSATAAAAGAVAVWASSPNPVQPEMTNLEVVQEDLREGAEALIDLGRAARDAIANIFRSSRSDEDATDVDDEGQSSETGRDSRTIETGSDALDQLDSIEKKQSDLRRGKTDGVIIDSIEKSERRAQNALDRIRTLDDALEDWGLRDEDE